MDAIIGGTGLNELSGLVLDESRQLETRWGQPSANLKMGHLNDHPICFLARHGQPHHIPPHRINYRANIQALKDVGVTRVIAVNAVGGIHAQLAPGELSIPDQIIDYTCGREHTYYDGTTPALEHVDFTEPFTQSLRLKLIRAAQRNRIKLLPYGTYAATNGPRLESAAEIIKIKQDGGDLVGMTGMPEAALAREAEIEYACIAVSVNWAAGLHGLEPISMASIRAALEKGMANVEKLLNAFFD